ALVVRGTYLPRVGVAASKVLHRRRGSHFVRLCPGGHRQIDQSRKQDDLAARLKKRVISLLVAPSQSAFAARTEGVEIVRRLRGLVEPWATTPRRTYIRGPTSCATEVACGR